MRSRSQSNSPLHLVGLAIILAIAVGGFGYITWESIGKQTPDEFGCFASDFQKETVVLVDVSEPRFNSEQSRSLQRYFEHLYDALEFNEKLSVVTTAENQIGSIQKPRFHICGQAENSEQLKSVNADGASAGYLAKQKFRIYEEKYMPSVQTLLSTEPDLSSRQRFQSPVLEIIQSIRRFHPLEAGDRLVVISDLIQNSDSVQFCRTQNDMPPFSVFSQRSVYERLKPKSLEGVDAEVLMIQRQGYGQDQFAFCYTEDELQEFWRDYLIANGVEDPNFVRIRHGYIEE